MTRVNTMLASEVVDQRITIPTRENPRKNRDYILMLKNVRSFALLGDGVNHELSIKIRYVPDRLICDTRKIESYFSSIASQPCSGLEELANAIADDFSNELIPRWISVDLTVPVNGIVHNTHVEDKQPLWNNPAMLLQV